MSDVDWHSEFYQLYSVIRSVFQTVIGSFCKVSTICTQPLNNMLNEPDMSREVLWLYSRSSPQSLRDNTPRPKSEVYPTYCNELHTIEDHSYTTRGCHWGGNISFDREGLESSRFQNIEWYTCIFTSSMVMKAIFSICCDSTNSIGGYCLNQQGSTRTINRILFRAVCPYLLVKVWVSLWPNRSTGAGKRLHATPRHKLK